MTTKRKRTAAAKGADAKPPLSLQYVLAKELRDKRNPLNWRRHPESQLTALKTLIADPAVGWAGAMLLNTQTGKLIDGHARLDSVPDDALVPVLVGSWTPEAERKILATLDPLSAMAVPDPELLGALLTQVDLSGLLAGLGESVQATLEKALASMRPSAPAEFPEQDENISTEHTCPKCGYKWSGGK